MANKITINGKTYAAKGTITIEGDTIFVGGRPLLAEELEDKIIHVHITGDKVKVDRISGCASVEVHGKVDDIETVTGDVRVIGNVSGDIETVTGNIRGETFNGECSTVNGNITGIKKDI